MEDREPLGPNQDWMSRLPEQLLDVPLWDLAIPGSHDSMSYCLDGSSPLLRSEPALLRLSDQLCPCWTRPCVERWATTQQTSLRRQCDLGVRFLDLRIAKKPKSQCLFFAHGLYTLTTVKEALTELSHWLDAHKQEVLLLCCSHFESVTEQDHQDLLNFINSEFRGKICSSQCVPTLRSCWSRGHQVIISYDDQQVALKHPELWPATPYRYADSANPHEVIAYLNQEKLRGRPARFFVSGLNLTEDAAYVLLHPRQDMRKMTTKALKLLLGWTAEAASWTRAGRREHRVLRLLSTSVSSAL
uniref:PI-PLC X domain-containing protein 1-like n=1 Tax=Gouania willdenowi TaxID=441366 RepID=A0A8C5G0Z3_GOUWI